MLDTKVVPQLDTKLHTLQSSSSVVRQYYDTSGLQGSSILIVSDMFPTSGSSMENPQYDFFSDENASKWKDLFVSALSKVQ